MDKQYVALPDPTWEGTNSGGLFRSVTSSMPGEFHFNLLIFVCPVGGGGAPSVLRHTHFLEPTLL